MKMRLFAAATLLWVSWRALQLYLDLRITRLDNERAEEMAPDAIERRCDGCLPQRLVELPDPAQLRIATVKGGAVVQQSPD